MTPAVAQQQSAARMAQRVEDGVSRNARALKAVTPRWVEHSLGLNLGDVIAAFKRQCALGKLEQVKVEGSDEIYYRRKGVELQLTRNERGEMI